VDIGLDLTGRTCLVIGGAGTGIGAAVASGAASAGAAVGVITHNPAHAEEMQARLTAAGARAAAVVADVSDDAALVAAIAQVDDALGPIDGLVNVVGGALGVYDKATDADPAEFDRVFAHNVRYVLVSCREVAGRLVESGRPGRIVNISSTAAKGVPLLGAYSAAKAGLESMSRSMALEWGPHGIRVNAVAAGAIRTDNRERAAPSVPLRRRGEPDEVAAAVLFLLSDRSAYTTGHVLAVDGGAHLGHAGGEGLSPLAGGR